MKNIYSSLEQCPLFSGINGQELESLLGCLNAKLAEYEKNGFIFLTDEAVRSVGVVLSGSVHVIKEDFWGKRAIIARIGRGGLFAEAFSCAGERRMPVSVMAAERSEIMLIDYKRIITSCPTACAFHSGLIRNMLSVLARKNIALTHKIEHMTQRTTREKLLSYLSEQAAMAHSRAFEIPFDRQELADYLSVDRSAMSSELSKMRDEGLIRYERSRFELLV